MKGVKIVFALVVISVMAMGPGSANAVLFETDFESYSVGSVVGQDGWTEMNSVTANVDWSIYENQFMPGYQYLVVGQVGAHVGRDINALYRPFTPTAQVHFEVLYMGRQSETSWRSVSLRDNSGVSPEYYYNSLDIAAMVGSEKNYDAGRWWFFAYDSDGRQWYEGAHDVLKENVYKIVIDADVGTQTYDATVNLFDEDTMITGAQVASWSSLSFANTVSEISRVFVESWDSASFWDHFLIEAPPAPSFRPADFNEDGDVDAFDFADWQANYPTASGATKAMGDANGDGDVDAFDFADWQADYPYPAPEPTPEPATLGLLLLGGLVLLRRRR